MTTNGRNKVILEEGDSHYYGQAVLDKSTMTNIVSMSNAIKKGFRIFFDSSKENCFYVIDWKERNIHYPYHKKGYMFGKLELMLIVACTGMPS